MNRYVVIDRQKIKDKDYVYYLVNYEGNNITLTGKELFDSIDRDEIIVRNMEIKRVGNIRHLSYSPFKINRLDNSKVIDKDKQIYKQIMMLSKMYFKPLEEITDLNCKVYNLGYNLESPMANEKYQVKFAIVHKNLVNIVTLCALMTGRNQIIFEVRYLLINRVTNQKDIRFNMLYDANSDMHKLICDILMSLGINTSLIKFY